MLRIAILENEEAAKNIMFSLAQYLQEEDCCFYCFKKISQFAKAEAEKEFHVVIFHEKMEVPRITQSFVLRKPQRIIIYTKTKISASEQQILPFSRIFYVERKHLQSEMERILPHMQKLLRNQDEYLFFYNNVKVPLKISDIYYIEKEGKLLVYHTRRGEFRERKNMKDAYEIFKPYNFLWIHVSYLVNIMYIMKIENDMVMLPSLHLPISRSKKAEVLSAFYSLIE